MFVFHVYNHIITIAFNYELTGYFLIELPFVCNLIGQGALERI